MGTSDMIREVCKNLNISISELARRIGQTPQNFIRRISMSLSMVLCVVTVPYLL